MIPLVLDLSPETLEAMRVRLDKHLYGKAKTLSPNATKAAELAGQDSGASHLQAGDGNMVDAGQPPARLTLRFSPCPDCAWLAEDGEGPCATHRRACEGCGRSEGLHDGDVSKTKLGPGESPIVERWCSHCDPVGNRYADAEPDPWDLPESERNSTADLSRESPAYWGRDRSDWDELDTRSDIQPFERTTK